METWNEFYVSDVISTVIDYRGKTPKKLGGDWANKGYRALSAKNVKTGEIVQEETIRYISEEMYHKWMKEEVQRGDILITSEAPFGQIYYWDSDEKIVLSQRLFAIRTNANFYPKYIYFYMTTPRFQAELAGKATGTTVLGIRQPELMKCKIFAPRYEMQKQIGDILWPIEEKINLNTKINQNLGQQAHAVFKSWFVDFDPFDEPFVITPAGFQAPASLQMIQIADIPHILETGKRPKGGAVAEGIPSIGAENVKQLGKVDFSSAKFIPVDYATSLKTGKVHGYELMLYKDGGKPGTFIPHFSMFGEGFPYEDFFINEHVFKLDFHDRGYNEFAYFYMQTDYPYSWLSNNGGKAAVPGINRQDVNSIWIFSPHNSKVQEYCKWVQPIFTTILRNCAQNIKLANLRDILLPKLLSGELDISVLDI